MTFEERLAICVEVLRRYGATKIYLFGSHARGDARPDSDLDFAVEGVGGDAHFRLLGEIERLSRGGVDVVLLQDDGPLQRVLRSEIASGQSLPLFASPEAHG